MIIGSARDRRHSSTLSSRRRANLPGRIFVQPLVWASERRIGFLPLFILVAIAFLSCLAPDRRADAQTWCGQAKSPSEITICNTEELSRREAALQRAYSAKLSKLSGPAASAEKKAQAEWLRLRDFCQRGVTCIGTWYDKRIVELGGTLEKKLPPKVPGQPNWCDKAANPAEQTICKSLNLGPLEVKVEETYSSTLAGADEKTSTLLRQSQIRWLQARDACTTNRYCINEKLRERLSSIITNPEESHIYYGSKAGMYASILSRAGLDTSNASISVSLMPKDAKAYCVDYESDYSMACVKRVLKTVIVPDRVTADCTRGTWTDLNGGNLKFDEVQGLEDTIISGKEAELTLLSYLCPTRYPHE